MSSARPALARLQEAVSCLARHDGVEALYLFGSCARGEDGESSDMDLAVFLERPADLSAELRLRSAATAALRTDEVDLVVLNRAPPLLRREVVATGKRLHARDAARMDVIEARWVMECLDSAWLRTTQQRLAREESFNEARVMQRYRNPPA